MASPTDYDAAFESARAMKVSEIKAELDLRGISHDGLFEKSELARALALSRSQGRADPEILNQFNRQKMEKMMQDGEETASQTALDESVVADAVAGDGSLPGGLSPERLRELMSNPGALTHSHFRQRLTNSVALGRDDGALGQPAHAGGHEGGHGARAVWHRPGHAERS